MYPKILLNILYEGIEDYEGLRLLTEFTMDQYEFGDVGPIFILSQWRSII